MELKNSSNKGVQQEDVWAAADSLIADGLRPTIERVRQRIGRGSPNTVSPMLESWFATLATRLGVNKQEEKANDVPTALQQALQTTWEIALSKGREISALEIVQAQNDFNQAIQTLKEREIELDQMEQVRAVKRQALEEVVNSSKIIADNAIARLDEAQRLARRQEMEIHDLQIRLVAVELARDTDSHRNQEMATIQLLEQQKIEDRAQAAQRRLLEEIDRARQEIKKAFVEAEKTEKIFSTKKFQLEEKISIQEKEQLKVQALYTTQSVDLHVLRETLAASDLQSKTIQVLLKAQLDDSKGIIARLTEAFSNQDARQISRQKFSAPKFKRERTARKA